MPTCILPMEYANYDEICTSCVACATKTKPNEIKDGNEFRTEHYPQHILDQNQKRVVVRFTLLFLVVVFLWQIADLDKKN